MNSFELSFLRDFSELNTSSNPPNPMANAPVANGLTFGVKLAAVPVVPHNKHAKIIAALPLKIEKALTSPLLVQTIGLV